MRSFINNRHIFHASGGRDVQELLVSFGVCFQDGALVLCLLVVKAENEKD